MICIIIIGGIGNIPSEALSENDELFGWGVHLVAKIKISSLTEINWSRHGELQKKTSPTTVDP